MEPVLLRLGLSKKEAEFYLHLLKEGSLTASQISKRLKETRTNSYMILARLVDEKLVNVNDATQIKLFAAAPPKVLQQKLDEEENRVRKTRQELGAALPELQAIFKTGRKKVEAVKPQSLKKYRAVLETIASSSQTVNIIAGDDVGNSQDAWAFLQEVAKNRAGKRRTTHIVLHESFKGSKEAQKLTGHGVVLQFSREKPKVGGVVIFGSRVALIKDTSGLVVKVINNDALAESFRIVFRQLWQVQAGKGVRT